MQLNRFMQSAVLELDQFAHPCEIRALQSNLPSFPVADKGMDLSVREDLEDTCLRDSISITSTDSFVSAAEVRGKSLCLSAGVACAGQFEPY